MTLFYPATFAQNEIAIRTDYHLLLARLLSFSFPCPVSFPLPASFPLSAPAPATATLRLLGLAFAEEVGAEFRLSGDDELEIGNKLAKREDSEERPCRLSFSFLEEEEEVLGMDLDFFVGVALLGEGEEVGMGWRTEACREGGRWSYE